MYPYLLASLFAQKTVKPRSYAGALACGVRPIQGTKNTGLVKILQDGQRLRSENILREGT